MSIVLYWWRPRQAAGPGETCLGLLGMLHASWEDSPTVFIHTIFIPSAQDIGCACPVSQVIQPLVHESAQLV